MYITAYTWEQRSYPRECQKSNKLHSMYMAGDNKVSTFKYGARQMDPVEFAAGETRTFVLEWDWSREDVSPDWSLTAWAEKGEVAVVYTGHDSDSLPLTQPKVDDMSHEESIVASSYNLPGSSQQVDEMQE